ncbi:hypothetical protein ACJMK2_015343 [Sinanodonta woodiana]|uniref:Ninjurin-2 n=1 Tax=Sinanodonta woodiana TaxID=1069815 RepID=A0ABD3URE4_SINWO
MANASQLKTVIAAGDAQQEFYWPLLILISLSLLIQIVVGILLIVLGNMELHDPLERNKVNTINNIVTGMIFSSTVINIFIAAFGIKLSDDKT